MGGSPKALRQHLAGETSLLRDHRSPTAVARASMITWSFLSQQVRVPDRMALAEITKRINDLVTTMKPGIRVGPHETCS